MKVLLESPFAGNTVKHIAYAKKCMLDCFNRGELPFASHLLYTQPGILKDYDPKERELGIAAGLAWGAHAEKTVVYLDHGVSKGMLLGIEAAKACNRVIEYRNIEEFA